MKKTWILVLIILALSITTHFAFFGRPNETVFDEVHFGKFISGYLNHKYFFDIHPPLGKLMISGIAKLSGYKTGFDFKEIGEKYPDNSYIWLRLLPVIFGTLLPLVIFFLARNLKLSTLTSFAAGLLIIFENALLGQSLFILLDSMLLLFGFLGLLLYLMARRKKSIWIFILAVISLSFSLSIKWTGLSFLGLVLVLEIVDLVKDMVQKRTVPCYWWRILIIIFLPIVIYFSIFALHFAILNKTGDGDGFMSREFQKTLAGSNYQNDSSIEPANMAQKFLELNLEMFRSNKRISDNHPYASQWFTWPMMAKPIYYWNSDETANQAKIYLFGNPIIFWGSFLGVVILILDCLFFFREMRRRFKTIMFILAGFILNYLPFVFITRPMFLYHYLAALVFAILALCFALNLIQNRRQKIIIFVLLLALAAASFFFFSPLTYGLRISPNSFNARLWTHNWQ
ncbi:MAG: dolichyl-phosphate-mannose-protein mannosyltransferase [Candidatus Berkelbacteria bacterium Licking1014_96]|uniref:Polyprenol-phosphate-mannose--protein mannosyltransferase n=1 Tax=Candidatus Berkelbacteria bacterium Licking1014_96 TaxID=2017149 RepID=A0A554LH77_9BACT|nr:MAG: dolichyl-phosphate-mannose-protein mannosyltransferase [Candidatus Berkelbacteria bacterium Licking1014_96]